MGWKGDKGTPKGGWGKGATGGWSKGSGYKGKGKGDKGKGKGLYTLDANSAENNWSNWSVWGADDVFQSPSAQDAWQWIA